MTDTSIIIVTWNNKNLLEQCLASLWKYTVGKYEVIVIDNGSSDGTKEYLEKLEKENAKTRCIYNTQNLGYIQANNQGILMAQGKYICLLNNDTVLTRSWLTKLKRVLEQYPQVGITGPYTNYAAGRQRIAVSDENMKDINGFLDSLRMPEQDVDSLIFFCALIRAELFNKNQCGLLDSDFGIGNFEDTFFCWTAKKLGYKLRVANCFVFHRGSQSFKKDPQKFTALLANNQKIFYRKIGQSINISLCIAVADSEKLETLRRNLLSSAPFVDEICLAINYKQTPNENLKYSLLAVAGEFGIPIKSLYTPWQNDFSEAKNKALELATGEWCLMLDCADTLEYGLMLRKYIVENKEIADYMFVNTFARAEDGVDTHLRHARIIRNDTRYRYRKPVHEDIVLSLKEHNARKVSTDMIIRHHGYEIPASTFTKNIRNYKIMRKYIVNNPNADSLDFFHLANAYILLSAQSKKRKKEWYIKALGAIEKCLNIPLLEDDPLWPKMTFLKARIYHEIQEIEKAKEWYKIGIEKKNYIESHLGLAEILVAEKNYDGALWHLETMLKIGTQEGFEVTSVPKNLQELEEAMFYNLGLCHFNKQNILKAKEYLQQCISLNKCNMKAVDLLCECLRQEDHFGTAFQISLKAVNLVPGYVNGWINAGGFELTQGNLSTARVLLQEALRLAPDNEMAKKNLEIIKQLRKN